jgi:KaiC/GvpD/RAD55 family RecA-like ATPase
MADTTKRCPTGIPGFDEIIEGGFPRKRSILLSGTCGSGKTTFAIQFLYNGIVKYNEPGILISLEQEPSELKEDMMNYGFDLDKAEKDGKLAIIDASLSRVGITMDAAMRSGLTQDYTKPGSVSLLMDEFNMDNILELTVSKAKKMGAKRVVFDSLPALDFMLTGDGNREKMQQTIRQVLVAVNYRLKGAGLTTLMITEMPEGGSTTVHGAESYVADGVINLYNTTMGMQSGMTLLVKKMRGTDHSRSAHPIVFKKGKGIEVKKPPEKVDL